MKVDILNCLGAGHLEDDGGYLNCLGVGYIELFMVWIS